MPLSPSHPIFLALAPADSPSNSDRLPSPHNPSVMPKELGPRIASYLAKNQEWAQSANYKSPIPYKEMQEKGRAREDGTVIVLACTDPRVTPEEFLGMDSTSKATVVRTAGGRAHAAMSTLLVLAAVGNLGKKGVIMVVHHTDCGLQTAGDEEIRDALGKGVSENGKEILKGVKFGSFVHPEESVKEDVSFLRASPFFKGMDVLGFVQNTQTGLLSEVAGPAEVVDITLL